MFIFKPNVYDEINAAAVCKYSPSLEKFGWDFLAISSNIENISLNAVTKSYAMGYLEGIVTKDRIFSHYLNMRAYNWYDFPNRTMPQEVKDFLNNHFNFIDSLISGNDHDEYFEALSVVISQYKGLVDGYNLVTEDFQKLYKIEFLNMAAFGDLEDVPLFSKNLREFLIKKNHTTKDSLDYIDKHSHCSVLFKVLPDFSNLFFGHNTWYSYSSMSRIYKEYRYKLDLQDKPNVVLFSGYPGTLSSIDDFFITDKKLVVTETTNQVFREELFDSLTPKSLLSWERSMIANLIANNSEEWAKIFSKYNSGTYNNQYMILDLKKVDTKGRVIQNSSFWVLEQIPTLIVSKDMTDILRYGYWPSYNVAVFEEIREISGLNQKLKDNPDMKNVIDYSLCARAKIFRRDEGKVNSMYTFKKLMRYNNWKYDEFGENRPDFAISARKDLFEDDPQCKGGLDSKVSDVKV